MKRFLFCALTILWFQSISAQDIAAFINSSELLANKSHGGPICKGFTDINGDFRDDLVRVSNATRVVVDLQSNNGEFFNSVTIDTILGDSWTLSVGDVDNDGFSDIMSAGNYNGMRIYKTGRTHEDIEKMYETNEQFFAQASNFVDVNNDGWLDLFICDDDGHSEFFINDGTGGFMYDPQFINMRTVPMSDNSGNYGSVWTDIDGDDDLDLYIAKCRLGVPEYIEDSMGVATTVKDPRRINALFINDNGVFTEQAAAWGIDVSAQSWTANFGDIDNDGDQDLFVVNHEFRFQLFENVNNQSFQEIPLLDSGDEILADSYQSAMADFNNDGYLDILVTGGGDRLLLNNGNNTFAQQNTPVGTSQTQSFALGDANEDGFMDILASYRGLGSGLSGDRDKLWTNITNENHYVAISLNGNQSNRNGVGAKILLHTPKGIQTRVIKSGVGYGITNSLTARFGTDDDCQIDSIVIKWPSGIKDVFQSPDCDQHYVAHEGACMTPLALVGGTGSRINCVTEEVTLSVDNSFMSANWSDGQSGLSIQVTEPDYYSVTVTDSDGCESYGQSILVRGPEVLPSPQINIVEDVVLCEGSTIDLGLRTEGDFSWSTNEMSESISITESGTYYAVSQNECDTINSNSVNVTLLDPDNPGQFFQEYDVWNSELDLTVSGDNVTWYSDAAGTNEIGTGNTFTTDPISTDTTFYFDQTIEQKAPVYVGALDIQRSIDKTEFANPNVAGSVFFVVDEPALWKSFTVNSAKAGDRQFFIIKVIGGDTVHQKRVFIDEGVHEVALDFIMEPGSYEVRTDIALSIGEFGTSNPELSKLEGDFEYPYRIGDIARISRSFGPTWYLYYFDWKMQPLIEDCQSGIIPFELDFMTTSTEELQNDKFEIYPNPTKDIIFVKGEEKIQTIKMYNPLNQLVRTISVQDQNIEIDLSDMVTGHYLMVIEGDSFKAVKQIIKTK